MGVPLHLKKKKWIPYPQRWSVPSLVKIGLVVLEKKIFKWSTLFCIYLPFEEDQAFYFDNFEFPLPKDDLYQVWLRLATWFWKRFLF
jgi:hypothetical protein